jgi:hypothetical protein
LEYKYDDPEDHEVPHLDPSDPFVILQHSSIKYADLFKRIKEEQAECLSSKTKREKRNLCCWSMFYEKATWCERIKNNHDWITFGYENQCKDGINVWINESAVNKRF